jgi:beta-glucosidase
MPHDDSISRTLFDSSNMSLEDQIGQMAQLDIHMLLQDDGYGGKRLNPASVNEWIGEKGIGSVLNLVDSVRWTVQEYRQMLVQIQKVAAAHQRPPVVYGIDSVHGGNYFYGSVVTPQPLNIAATFNTTTALQAGLLASRQTRSAGITWLFSPLVGIALEPRWSRVYETFGEDPVVVGQMAAAMIRGIQLPDNTMVPSRAAACAKHFVGYSMPRTGHDRAPSWIPTRHLYQYFVPPWTAVMKEGVMTVMESYTEQDGVPNAANAETTVYLLRQRLGFDGVLVTDYHEMENLYTWHKTASSLQDAVNQMITQSSVDMSMLPDNFENFRTSILSLTEKGGAVLSRIDKSAQRILQLKQDLGMMDEELLEDVPDQTFEEDEAMALEMVRQSIVLVQNKDNTLPLLSFDSEKKRLSVLVTGPTANSLGSQSGGWTGHWQGVANEVEDDWFTYGSTVVGAFSAESQFDVSYRCGVDIVGDSCEPNDDNKKDNDNLWNQAMDHVKDWAGITHASSIGHAVDAAATSDLIIICLGEEPYAEKPADIRSLALPVGQYTLVQAIRSQAPPTAKIVLVYFGGRPRLLKPVVDLVDAVLIGFLPGPSAGQAVVEIITGQVNPSGKLPITYPMYDDGGGSPYFSAVSDQCTRGDGPMPHWEYTPRCDVQWPFGHGLSYTQFEYTDLQATGGIDSDLKVSVTVQNTGASGGAETVLFFTFDEFRRTTPEYKRLRAFEKVYLEAGAKLRVETTISVEDLKFVGPDDDRHYILDPAMTSWVGVGATTDCRTHSEDCVHLHSDKPDRAYVGACEEACTLWATSGCSATTLLSDDKVCWSMCTQSAAVSEDGRMRNELGWGWNYVNCLESVVYGIQGDTSQCWKMTSFCRDIFRTGDEHERFVPLDTYVALVVGLISGIIIVLLMRGRLGGAAATRRRRNIPGETEFVRVGTEDLQ